MDFNVDPRDPNAALLVHLLQRQDTLYGATQAAQLAINDHAAHLNAIQAELHPEDESDGKEDGACPIKKDENPEKSE